MNRIVLLVVCNILTQVSAEYLIQGGSKLRNENHVLYKYLRPIRGLIEDLPHHNVEVQLEVAGINANSLPMVAPSQRRYRVKEWPHHKYMRAAAAAKAKPPTKAPAAQTTVASTTVAIKKLKSEAETEDPEKKPVYMEDLKKALEEFEKKIDAKNKNSEVPESPEVQDENQPLLKKDLYEALGCKDGHKNKENQGNENSEHSSNPSNGRNMNVERILNLLQKGIEIKRDVPSQNDDSLHWMQIKIPKGLDIHV